MRWLPLVIPMPGPAAAHRCDVDKDSIKNMMILVEKPEHADDLWQQIVSFVGTWLERQDRGVRVYPGRIADRWREDMQGNHMPQEELIKQITAILHAMSTGGFSQDDMCDSCRPYAERIWPLFVAFTADWMQGYVPDGFFTMEQVEQWLDEVTLPQPMVEGTTS